MLEVLPFHRVASEHFTQLLNDPKMKEYFEISAATLAKLAGIDETTGYLRCLGIQNGRVSCFSSYNKIDIESDSPPLKGDFDVSAADFVWRFHPFSSPNSSIAPLNPSEVLDFFLRSYELQLEKKLIPVEARILFEENGALTSVADIFASQLALTKLRTAPGLPWEFRPMCFSASLESILKSLDFGAQCEVSGLR